MILHCALTDYHFKVKPHLDHRPLTSVWYFSFERFNGIMGSTSTNKRYVELHLMRKLLISRQLKSIMIPDEYQDDFTSLCCHSRSFLSKLVRNTAV